MVSAQRSPLCMCVYVCVSVYVCMCMYVCVCYMCVCVCARVYVIPSVLLLRHVCNDVCVCCCGCLCVCAYRWCLCVCWRVGCVGWCSVFVVCCSVWCVCMRCLLCSCEYGRVYILCGVLHRFYIVVVLWYQLDVFWHISRIYVCICVHSVNTRSLVVQGQHPRTKIRSYTEWRYLHPTKWWPEVDSGIFCRKDTKPRKRTHTNTRNNTHKHHYTHAVTTIH